MGRQPKKNITMKVFLEKLQGSYGERVTEAEMSNNIADTCLDFIKNRYSMSK